MVDPIILDYKEYPIRRSGDRGEIGSKKPIIQIASRDYPNRKVDCLLDSGADSLISFKAIGETFFGISFSKEDEIPNNISGLHTCPDFKCEKHPDKTPLYLKPVTFRVNERELTLNVRWLDRKFNPMEDFLFLLGRDFFEYFDVLFKQRNEQVCLYTQ